MKASQPQVGLGNSFENDSFLKNDVIPSQAFQNTKDFGAEKEKKNLFFNVISKNKKVSQFTSLEKIEIVIEGLMSEVDEREVCRKEGISFKVYSEWKKEFLGAFNKYSEMSILQKAISSKNRKLVLSEVGLKAYSFFDKFIDVTSEKNLVVPKGKILSSYSDFNEIDNVVLLNKVNNFRQINKQFEEVNRKLNNGGVILGRFQTFTSRAKENATLKIPVLGRMYFGLQFLFKRVFPKLPFFKKMYFLTTKGKDRLLSKAEVLGRLVSCGFDITEYEEIDGMHYFSAKKVGEPVYNMNPSYGPLFKMQRIGKNGKMIGVYKFRTMHPYSEYLQDYILRVNGYAESGKPADDFRLVPWGKFLRRYWLDELPQLINVLKGDLKLVGVRPVSKRFFQDIPKDIQDLRLTQKPGCIPPYVALDRKGSVDGVLGAEREYLKEKAKNPYFTDTKFFFKAIYNIVFKNKRSA